MKKILMIAQCSETNSMYNIQRPLGLGHKANYLKLSIISLIDDLKNTKNIEYKIVASCDNVSNETRNFLENHNIEIINSSGGAQGNISNCLRYIEGVYQNYDICGMFEDDHLFRLEGMNDLLYLYQNKQPILKFDEKSYMGFVFHYDTSRQTHPTDFIRDWYELVCRPACNFGGDKDCWKFLFDKNIKNFSTTESLEKNLESWIKENLLLICFIPSLAAHLQQNYSDYHRCQINIEEEKNRIYKKYNL